MMDKPKYRFNHKTGKCDRLYKIPTHVDIVTSWTNLDGSRKIITCAIDSPLVDLYTGTLRSE